MPPADGLINRLSVYFIRSRTLEAYRGGVARGLGVR